MSVIGADQSVGARFRGHVAFRVLWFALTALFSVPFLNPIHRDASPTFDSEWFAVLLLVVAALAMGLARSGPTRLQWPLPLFLFVLGLIAALQYLVGMLVYSYAFVTLVLGLIAVTAAYTLGRWVVGQGYVRTAMKLISVGLLAGSSLSVLVQWLQVFDVRGLPAWLYFEMSVRDGGPIRPLANLAQANHLATYIAMGLGAVLYLQRRDLSPPVVAITLAYLAGGLALTGSRMALLMLAAVVAWCLAPTSLRPECHRRRWLTVGALLAGYVATTLAGPWLQQTTGAVESSIERLAQGNFGYRLVMWRDAVKVALDHPLLGVGIGEYGRAQYLVASAHPLTVATPYAHNLILEIAAQFGIPAALFLVGIAIWWARTDIRGRVANPESAAALLFLGVLGIHSMLEWPLWHLYFAVPAALLFALAEPQCEQSAKGIDARKVLAIPALAALPALIIMKADFDEVARINEELVIAEIRRVPPPVEAVAGAFGVAGATLFKPQVDRMLLALYPANKVPDRAQVELAARVLSRVADDRVISRYIVALALSGRVQESVEHVGRLRVFAPDHGRYEQLRDLILQSLRDASPEVDPVRRALLRDG